MGQSQVTGVLLAGGASSRMHLDKSQLIFNGKTLFENSKAIFAHLVADQVIDDFVTSGNFSGAIPDLWPNLGPVGGILTVINSLKLREGHILLIIPVDMPKLNYRALAKLVTEAVDRGVSCCYANSWLPLALTINKEIISMAEQIKNLSKTPTQGMSVKRVFLKSNGVQLTPDDLNQLFNVNTPEDWQLLTQRTE
jgi:molybdopterin-guanine dinucleotide biosynthesis protein A